MASPSNPGLVQAIQVVLGSSEFEMEFNFKPLLEALISSVLVVPESDELSVVESEDEEAMLALFTDVEALSAYAPAALWRTMTGEEAIRRVARGDFDGLVVNAGGRAFDLSRDDVLALFEIDDPR